MLNRTLPRQAEPSQCQMMLASLLRVQVAFEREQVRLDEVIRAHRLRGMSCRRLAALTEMPRYEIGKRLREMGLPALPCGRKPVHTGLSAAQIEVFRLYRRKKFSSREARAKAIGAGP